MSFNDGKTFYHLTWEGNPSRDDLARALALAELLGRYTEGETPEGWTPQGRFLGALFKEWQTLLAGEDSEWRNPTLDLTRVSQLWPGTLFTVEADEIDHSSRWRMYVRDGAMQTTYAKMKFEPYDRAKMVTYEICGEQAEAGDAPAEEEDRPPLNQSLSQLTPGHYATSAKNILAWRLDDALEYLEKEMGEDTETIRSYIDALPENGQNQLDALIDQTAEGYDQELADRFVELSEKLFAGVLQPLATGEATLDELIEARGLARLAGTANSELVAEEDNSNGG